MIPNMEFIDHPAGKNVPGRAVTTMHGVVVTTQNGSYPFSHEGWAVLLAEGLARLTCGGTPCS
jgi:hypothetical protein